MKKQIIVKLFVAATVVATSIIPLQAGSWNWTRPYKMPEKNVNTLVVIGNYRKPRLLADLIQNETKQPILLIPSNSDGKIFFLPAKDQTMPIELGDLTDFIKYLKPGKIMVLGDKRYVPEKYLKAIDSSQTVISVSNKDWNKVAKTSSRILDLTYLERRFRKYENKIESGDLYRPDNPAMGENSVIKEDDKIVVVDETELDETSIIIEDKVDDPSKDGTVPAKDITAEPKLIDEGKVIPQK
jgi:hypothetical protein